MIYALAAGVLNALGTLFLKLSSKSLIYIITSIIFYGLNFYLFRIALQNLRPSIAYCLLIISTLLFLKSFEIISLKQALSISEIFGIVFFFMAVYLFL